MVNNLITQVRTDISYHYQYGLL